MDGDASSCSHSVSHRHGFVFPIFDRRVGLKVPRKYMPCHADGGFRRGTQDVQQCAASGLPTDAELRQRRIRQEPLQPLSPLVERRDGNSLRATERLNALPRFTKPQHPTPPIRNLQIHRHRDSTTTSSKTIRTRQSSTRVKIGCGACLFKNAKREKLRYFFTLACTALPHLDNLYRLEHPPYTPR